MKRNIVEYFGDWLEKENLKFEKKENYKNYVEISINLISGLDLVIKFFDERITLNKSITHEIDFDIKKFWRSMSVENNYKYNQIDKLKDIINLIRLTFIDNSIKQFRVDEINLKNFRKFKDISLKLSNQFTLLIGENATGKTSILDGIATAIGGFLSGIDEVKSKDAHPITNKDVRFTIKDIQGNIDRSDHIPAIVAAKGIINNVELQWSRSLKSLKSNITKKECYNISNIANEIVHQIRDESNDREINLPVFSYHGTGRLWSHKKITVKVDQISRYSAYKDSLEAASNYKFFLKWFEKMDRNSFNMRKEIPILEAVRNSIKESLGMLLEIEIERIIYRENDLEIYFDENYIMPASSLSDGYRNIIGIVSDIAYRMAILNPHLGENVTKDSCGIVLIDEIDLHLHPKWQKKIVGILKSVFPKVQFIATSHSPFIIQSMEKGELLNLEDFGFNERHVAIDNITEVNEKSIEDISEEIMHIQNPEWSQKRKQMFETAKVYYEMLEEMERKGGNEQEVRAIKVKLDKAMIPYADNIAYAAYVSFLERKRLVTELKIGEKQNEISK